MRATLVAASLVSLALAAPAAAADVPDEPTCHGQYGPRTPEQEAQAWLNVAMEVRAENGLPADEAYIRELQRRGIPDDKIIVGKATAAERRYLRLRYRLKLGRQAERYLARRRDLSGGVMLQDRFPRKPLLFVYLTRNRAVHAARLRKLVPYPKLLRTGDAEYPERTLERIAHRINDKDDEALRKARFDVVYAGPSASVSRVVVALVTPRPDYAEYFARRYGPAVTVELQGTVLTELVCVEAGYYEAPDERTLLVHWNAGDSYAAPERIDVAEFDDRVELSVIERQPTANNTLGADPGPFKRRVTLSRPLGDRAVIDAADGAPLRVFGGAAGEPPCPRAGLDESIALRKQFGLPTDRERILRLLDRDPDWPYSRAERRWLRLSVRLESDRVVDAYTGRHFGEFAGRAAVGRYPHTPHLVVWFTRHIRRHQRNLGPAVRVRRAPLSSEQLSDLSLRIFEEAQESGNVLDGFGKTGFYVNDTWLRGARVLVYVRTQRRDAARYFRERYGPSVRVIVESRRWDCGEVRW